jgi:hypothetical protein
LVLDAFFGGEGNGNTEHPREARIITGCDGAIDCIRLGQSEIT